ncbi:GTPase family protein [Helcococcus kunzii]|uniref:GTPase family protein n=1 Tax=Helcococcus kunzii TaxID=40091 RepID=UPI0021A51658|nr:GTP-binding DUF697 domain-containing protein [Helcococcus kunzii]MCT1796339.1 GTP-binding DUF697 domain-containing protein [Helcococcus kunzii]MCT1989009.1 GTP-binding DUF697 domain-containing protein [Helcococcus kunzii]
MDNYDIKNVADKISEAISQEYSELEKLNVMVLGKTGVGKSTLINNMFNEKMAETGIGKPITKKMRKIEKKDFPLAIYDTPGLELGGENSMRELISEITSEINKGLKSADIKEMIHCIWYCVATPSHRFEQAEIDFLRNFLGETSKYNVPVILVLTQSYSKNDARELKLQIEKENLPLVNIIPVLAEDYKIDNDFIIKSYGLNSLAELMYEVIPEEVKRTFITVQKANLELKKQKAKAAVKKAATAAAAIGAVPIPFSDATILVPEQIAMLARITTIFGISLEKATIVAILSSTIGTSATTVLGRSVVSNILKFIPGAGSIAGGAISAATAATMTAALGEAYIVIMTMLVRGDINIEDLKSFEGKELIKNIFKKKLKNRKDEDGEEIE